MTGVSSTWPTTRCKPQWRARVGGIDGFDEAFNVDQSLVAARRAATRPLTQGCTRFLLLARWQTQL
jgi:hypothetical protein